MQATREQFRGSMDSAQAARQRGDTAAARAKMEQVRAQMDRQRDRHVSAVRNILTAEQRTQFDKNVTEFKARETQRGERGGRRGEGKGHERGQRGDRPAGSQGATR